MAVLASVALFGTGGCSRSQDATPAEQTQRPFIGLDLVHDFGRVIEGRKVEHLFSARNDFPIPIAIADDADIHKTCGCTTLEPSARCLQPGEKATIRMRVDTTGKIGRFRVGGLIRWQTDDGESWPLNLYLEGTAKTILATQPGLIKFSAADVAEQKTKELRVLNSLEVDWSTLCVDIEPRHAELVEKSVHSDHVKLILRPCPPSGVLDFSARLQLTAELARPNSGITHCSVAIPLQGSQRIDTQISPRVLFASWSAVTKKGTARFLVRGLTSEAPESISSISCDGFRAVWIAKDISSPKVTTYRTLQIELNLLDPDIPSFDLTVTRRVQIAFSSGRSLEVPVYFVAHQERS